MLRSSEALRTTEGCAGGAAASLSSTPKRKTTCKPVTRSAQVDQFGFETNVTVGTEKKKQREQKKNSNRMRAISEDNR